MDAVNFDLVNAGMLQSVLLCCHSASNTQHEALFQAGFLFDDIRYYLFGEVVVRLYQPRQTAQTGDGFTLLLPAGKRHRSRGLCDHESCRRAQKYCSLRNQWITFCTMGRSSTA